MAETGVPRLTTDFPQKAQPLSECLQALAKVLAEHQVQLDTFCAELESEYVRLFVAAKGGAASPPYASCYMEDRPPCMMGPPAQDMQHRLETEGLALDSQGDAGKLPPDHLATQLELLYYLFTLAASGDAAAAARAADLIDQAMAPWARRFTGAVAQADQSGFFAPAAAWMLQVLQATAAELQNMASQQQVPSGG